MRTPLGVAALTALVALVPALGTEAHGEDICVRLTVTGAITGPHTTGYRCVPFTSPTVYRDFTAGVSPWIDVTVEVMSPQAPQAGTPR